MIVCPARNITPESLDPRLRDGLIWAWFGGGDSNYLEDVSGLYVPASTANGTPDLVVGPQLRPGVLLDTVTRLATPADTVTPTQDVSISAWVFPQTGIEQYANIAGRTYASTHIPQYYAFKLAANFAGNGKFDFNIATGSSFTSIVDPTAYTLNEWYHLLGTYDGTTMTFYVNGVSVVTSTSRSGSLAYGSSGTFSVGGNAANAENFVGVVADVCVWERCLTSAEAWEFSRPAFQPIVGWQARLADVASAASWPWIIGDDCMIGVAA